MNAYEIIGKKLQQAREAAGMSQEELAKEMGCSQASLSNYELGKRRLYFPELKKICDILRRPLAYFLADMEENEGGLHRPDRMLKEPYLKEIVSQAQKLKPAQRKSVLEFIQWQLSKTGDKQ